MADVDGLGQAGRARRVDVQRAVIDCRRLVAQAREVGLRVRFDFMVDAGESRIAFAVNPGSNIRGELRRDRFVRIGECRADDDVLWFHDVDRMRQRVAGDVRIEERDDGADATYADPDRHIFGRIAHQQAYDVAGRQPLLQRPCGISAGPLG